MWMASYMSWFLIIITFVPESSPSFFFLRFTTQVKSCCCVIEIEILRPCEGPSVTFLSPKSSFKNLLRIHVVMYIIKLLLLFPSCTRNSILALRIKDVYGFGFNSFLWRESKIWPYGFGFNSFSINRCSRLHNLLSTCSTQRSHVRNLR